MPRRARILAASYPMHVILRGIDPAATFFETEGRTFFQETLGAVAAEDRVTEPMPWAKLTPWSRHTRSNARWRTPRTRASPRIVGCLRTCSVQSCTGARDCTNGGFVFGSPRFEQQVAAMVGRRTWKGSPGRPRKETDVGEQGTLGL